MSGEPVRLTPEQREIVADTIRDHCRVRGWTLHAVNPRTEQIETPQQIRAAVEDALRFYPAERVFLNPDCGFGTFANRPMNTLEIAAAKVAAMAAAARDLRGRR